MTRINFTPNRFSIKELKNKFSSDFDSFFSYMNKTIKFKHEFSYSGYKRHAGTDCTLLFTLCFYKLLSFGGSVSGFFNFLFTSNRSVSSDSFYRFQNNGKINWRKIQFKLVKKLLGHAVTSEDDLYTYLIIDDSLIAKSGRRIEGVSKVHDHTSGTWRQGYKFLGLSVLRGKFSTIVDFSLVSEGKKKIKAACRLQLSQRFYELTHDKITLACQLLGRAVSGGIKADYVLFDSWFFCRSLANKITGSRQKMHYVGGIKDGTRLFNYDTGKYTIGQLRKFLMNKYGSKRCKSLNSYYIEAVCELNGVGEVKIFFSRFSKTKKWVMIITSDIDLSYIQAIKIYSKRWSIEINFKDLKQYLGIARCQSNTFNAQIAHMSTACMLHAMLSLYKNNSDVSTFGVLFKNQRERINDIATVDYYWGQIEEVILWIAEIIGGADKVTVDELFKSAEYLGIKEIINCEVQLNLKFGTQINVLKEQQILASTLRDQA
jgi:hypothetical protein